MSIEIHPHARVGNLADLEDSAVGTRIVISDRSVIDSFVKSKPAGGLSDLIVALESYINSVCVLHTGNGLTIGECCSSHCPSVDVPIRNQVFQPSYVEMVIENDVWIGAADVLDSAPNTTFPSLDDTRVQSEFAFRASDPLASTNEIVMY